MFWHSQWSITESRPHYQIALLQVLGISFPEVGKWLILSKCGISAYIIVHVRERSMVNRMLSVSYFHGTITFFARIHLQQKCLLVVHRLTGKWIHVILGLFHEHLLRNLKKIKKMLVTCPDFKGPIICDPKMLFLTVVKLDI